MFDLKTTVNSIGILLTFIGVYVLYRYSPLNEIVIDGGDASTDIDEIERCTATKNGRMRVGVSVVLFGIVLQLVSNYVPSR